MALQGVRARHFPRLTSTCPTRPGRSSTTPATRAFSAALITRRTRAGSSASAPSATTWSIWPRKAYCPGASAWSGATADDTEIRDYINGRNVASCSNGGTVLAGYVDMATYSRFSNCMQSVRRGPTTSATSRMAVITQHSPIGTGGGRCCTNEQLRPGFIGAADIR